MRTFEATHPWLSFQIDLKKVPRAVWLLLGEAAALGERLKKAALPLEEGRLLDYSGLLKGVLANASLDGNGLSEDQVDRLFEGTLTLPSTQQYLKVEVENLVKATKQVQDRQIDSNAPLDPWRIQLLNAQVLKGLPWSEDIRPGEFRSVRNSLSADEGVPSGDIPAAMEQLCAWLFSNAFESEQEEEQVPLAIIRAVMAHLYLCWIRPFAEGNGRTARLVEHHLLLMAGLPSVAAHQFTIHAAATRASYFRELRQSTQAGGDPLPFLATHLRGAVEALRTLWEEVERVQFEGLWRRHLDHLFQPTTSANGARQLKLVEGLQQKQDVVSPGRIPQLTADLARLYGRLNPKTLQRDLIQLQEKGLVERVAGGVKATVRPLHVFRRDLLASARTK